MILSIYVVYEVVPPKPVSWHREWDEARSYVRDYGEGRSLEIRELFVDGVSDGGGTPTRKAITELGLEL